MARSARGPRRGLGVVASLAVAAVLTFTGTGRADPQGNVGLLPGVAGVGTEGRFWQRTVFYGAIRGDLLWLQDRPSEVGVGPYLEVATLAFDELRLGTGVTVLCPLASEVPLVVSGGATARFGPGGWEPGVAGRAFWGLRGFNFHGPYALAFGLSLGVEQGLGGSRESVVLLAAHVDSMVLALPLLAAYTWVAG